MIACAAGSRGPPATVTFLTKEYLTSHFTPAEPNLMATEGNTSMTQHKLGLIGLLALATGCTAQTPIKSVPYEVTRAVNFQSDGIRRFQHVTVRSFLKTNGRKAEISVRDCTLLGQGYKVNFATPAKINVPNYGRNMPKPRVNCTLDGKTKSVTAGRTNETEGEIFVGIIGGTGIFGPQAVAAASVAALGVVAARPAKDTDEFSINSVNIVFQGEDVREIGQSY